MTIDSEGTVIIGRDSRLGSEPHWMVSNVDGMYTPKPGSSPGSFVRGCNTVSLSCAPAHRAIDKPTRPDVVKNFTFLVHPRSLIFTAFIIFIIPFLVFGFWDVGCVWFFYSVMAACFYIIRLIILLACSSFNPNERLLIPPPFSSIGSASCRAGRSFT